MEIDAADVNFDEIVFLKIIEGGKIEQDRRSRKNPARPSEPLEIRGYSSFWPMSMYAGVID